ncbi:helix-turn-helix transcriptional regulator [Nonomuraea sp. LP-02]|uniref:helix-turn-helix domain-containing protein n=1 Tax=Nonomuraea sp. LP-02 TaxID=3097960 RepID=UPI002E30D3BC|nr:helix-turn-helix transcriptional regulator [Nonomuraea sp. LP-02]MED7929561.1 helix-turn-helix transcriptional regulator [Nonomuraea sp. LP-02]
MKNDFSRFVAAARDRRGLRQKDVAQRLGVSPATISNIENGHKRPAGDQWKQLACALGVPWQELLDRATEMSDHVERAIISSGLDREHQDALLLTYGSFAGRDSLENVKVLRHRDAGAEDA